MRKQLAAVAAALAAFMAATAATSADGFRPLVLAGLSVRWVEPARPLRVSVLQGHRSFPGARNCSRMTGLDALLMASGISRSRFDAELDAALAMWATAANVSFERVRDPEPADILIGAQADPEGFAFTNVVPGQGARAGQIESSTICLNPERRWKTGFDGNLDVFDLRYTLAHEIGHALGLDHPSRSGQLMSYRYDEAFRDLQAGDRAGIALVYGSPGRDRAPSVDSSSTAIRGSAGTLGIARD